MRKGFTLVELLVVIAVIGLLLAIVGPSLVRAKRAGRTIVCKSLSRNMTFAFYTYYTENRQLMPISVNDPVMRPWHTFDEFRFLMDLPVVDADGKQRRTGQLQEYKPTYPKKLICPEASYALNNPENGLYPIDRSYGLNAHVAYFADYAKRRLESQSSRIICMADALDWWFNVWECDKYEQYGEQWLGFQTYGMAGFRHSNKANIGYWDGHAEQMDSDELKVHLEVWRYVAQ